MQPRGGSQQPAGLILVSPLGDAFLASLSPLGTAGTWLNGASFLLMVAKESQQDQPADSSPD